MASIIKGEKRGRPGTWIVDYRDAGKKRHWRTFASQGEAKAFLRSILIDEGVTFCTEEPEITFEPYATKIIASRAAFVKEPTRDNN